MDIPKAGYARYQGVSESLHRCVGLAYHHDDRNDRDSVTYNTKSLDVSGTPGGNLATMTCNGILCLAAVTKPKEQNKQVFGRNQKKEVLHLHEKV